MQKSVLVLGGGVAGLTAAHELIERGFSVTVIEPHALAGGKAKSVGVAGTGTKGRKDLPGEHGFRFFPGFYQHLPETMQRIPYGKGVVLDNLVNATETFVADAEHGSFKTSTTYWGNLRNSISVMRGTNRLNQLGIPEEDLEHFGKALWQVFSMCQERRDTELDAVSWWEFMDADNRSQVYQDQMVINTTKTLVASDPWRATARTVGTIAIQMFQDMQKLKGNSDRVLCGPTNEVWIEPWYWHLHHLGVTFVHGESVTAITESEGAVVSIQTRDDANELHTHAADEYVLAVPVEVAAPLLKPLQKLDDQFKDLQELATMINWMNGIQYYLYEDVPIVHGHEMLPQTKWALTAISQAQFWPDFDLTGYGDGKVQGVLSVDISDWHVPGLLHKKPAINCTPEEIAEETWYQLKRAINVDEELLTDENKHSWFLDPDIQRSPQNPHENINLEPLLVNLINSWELRPNVATKLANLFLASDYVKNNTDLATMEGANESARRAVNYILDKDQTEHSHKPCKVFPLREPMYARLLQRYDKKRFDRGLPWRARPPMWLFWPVALFMVLYRLGTGLKK